MKLEAEKCFAIFFLDLRPEWKMLAHLKSIEETIAWFQNNPQPDLVFMDIELADGNCFSIFKTITITGRHYFHHRVLRICPQGFRTKQHQVLN